MLACRPTLLAFGSAIFLLSGCGALPGNGPSAAVIAHAGKPEQNKAATFHLVDVSEETVNSLMAEAGPSLRSSFGQSAPPPQQVFAVGDKLAISIFESASGGLFFGGDPGAPNGARQIALPHQVITEDGKITIPYAGTFKAAGSTPAALAAEIESKLDGRAVEPQVVISVVESTGNTATIMGEVNKSGRVNLSLAGDKVLSVLAEAGIKAAENEAVVRLVRRGQLQTVPLRTIINRPSENIYVFPGDTIFVLKDPQVFNVMGAVSKPGQYDIGVTPQSFAGALSLAGGLADNMADAGGIFLFRFETPDTARHLLGTDIALKETPAGVPMVYRIRFSDPNAFFWLQQLQIRSDDTIYVSNAIAREFDKFIGLLSRGALANARLTNN